MNTRGCVEGMFVVVKRIWRREEAPRALHCMLGSRFGTLWTWFSSRNSMQVVSREEARSRIEKLNEPYKIELLDSIPQGRPSCSCTFD